MHPCPSQITVSPYSPMQCQAGCRAGNSSPLRKLLTSCLGQGLEQQWLAGIQLGSRLFNPMALGIPPLLYQEALESRLWVERDSRGHLYCPSSLPSPLAAAVLRDVELSTVLITAQPHSLVPLETKAARSQEASIVAKTRASSSRSPTSHTSRDSALRD